MSLATLKARVAALQAGGQTPAPPSDPVFLTSNSLALVAGAVPSGFPPRRGQFFKALEGSGVGRVAAVAAAVPSDPGDATNVAFNHTTFVLQAGTFAQFVKTTLGLTDAQLAAIITSARAVTE